MTDDIVKYAVEGRIARITLNRPHAFNAIVDDTGRCLVDAVRRANADDRVHVIVLQGAGRAFCSGYDLKVYAETKGTNAGFQDMPWDPIKDYANMAQNTEAFMSLWRSLKPVVCRVHGAAVGGGSDIALCCDLVVMEEGAVIGYPPARVWGCPTTFMWVYRVGAERAKSLLLTGDVVTGTEAHKMGLVHAAVPADRLDATVDALAAKMARLPKNQLIMQKLVVNQAYDNMGMRSTQTLATVMDGIARHTPEGVAFKKQCETHGWKRAVRERDGPKRGKAKL